MHKNWKKRFKKFFFDIDNHLEIVGCSMLFGLLFGAGSLFVLDESFFGVISSYTTIGIIGFMYTALTGIMLFAEESEYDEKKEEKEKENHADNQKKEEEIKDYYYTLLSDNNRRYETGDKEVWFPISDLLETIYHITNSYKLTEEEKDYVTQKVTKDVYELVQIYEKLTFQNQREYRTHMISVVKQKNEELKRNVVDRFQHQIKQEFERKQQEIESKRYEHVYMND